MSEIRDTQYQSSEILSHLGLRFSVIRKKAFFQFGSELCLGNFLLMTNDIQTELEILNF
jgi:hypothetical protein